MTACVPRASRGLLLAAVAVLTGVFVASAMASELSDTVGFSFGSEVWVGQPVSITVSGTSSQAAELAVYLLSTGNAEAQCPSVSKDEEVVLGDLATPVPVSPGSYSDAYSYVPDSPTAYVFCAYLYDALTGAVYADGRGSFTAAYHVEKVSSGGEAGGSKSGGVPTGGTGSGTGSQSGVGNMPASPPRHLAKLVVKVRDHRGATARQPGRTELLISVTPGVDLRLVLKRHGRTLSETLDFHEHSSGKRVVRWSCSSPGGVYHYTLTATDAYGKTLTRRGTFHPVNATECGALRSADARRRREEAAARPREEREEERREREEAPMRKARADQDMYCEHVLSGEPLPAEGEGPVVTDCEVGRLVYILEGDPPKIVTVRERQ